MEFLEKLAKWIYNTHLSSEAKYGLKIPTWNQYANDHGIGWGVGGGGRGHGPVFAAFILLQFTISSLNLEGVAPPSHGIVFGTMADNVFSDN